MTNPRPVRASSRPKELAMIHIAIKDLNMPDDEYRALLKTVCGVDSSAKLDMAGRLRFLDHLKRCGWKPKSTDGKPHRKLAPKPAKIYSLWQQLHAAGKVEHRTFKAMEAWIKAQTGVDKLEWLNDAQAGQCIEQLKLWLARKSPLSVAKATCDDVVAKGGA
jgi:phage gp16-like protein